MTKKDYVAIAAVLSDALHHKGNDPATVTDILGRLIPVFGADNPRFDVQRFSAAVLNAKAAS